MLEERGVPPRLAERDRGGSEHPVRARRGARGIVAGRRDDQPDDPRRAGAGRRHPGGRVHRGRRKRPRPDGADAVRGPRGVAGGDGDSGAAAPGDAVHPSRVHPGIRNGGGGPRAILAARLGRRVLDDRQLHPVEHVRPRALRVAAPEQTPRPGRFTRPWLLQQNDRRTRPDSDVGSIQRLQVLAESKTANLLGSFVEGLPCCEGRSQRLVMAWQRPR